MLPPFFFVFDVEAIGLHGYAFAVGWVVIRTSDGEELANGILVDPIARGLATPALAPETFVDAADAADVEWVRANVMPALAGVQPLASKGDSMLRQFWVEWKAWEAAGALMAADVAWPVEARFLVSCAEEFQRDAQLDGGPYPLVDVASVRLARGLDPLATEPRLPRETPAHNPLADARQSARLLLEALRTPAPAEMLQDSPQ